MLKKNIVVANWKMNPQGAKEAIKLFNFLAKDLRAEKENQVIICSPFIFLPHLTKLVKKSNLLLGAQDCFWEDKGQYTGEISPLMLKGVGCGYVIIGHSERRHFLGETDEMVNKKLQTALAAGLKVILCVGEKQSDEMGQPALLRSACLPAGRLLAGQPASLRGALLAGETIEEQVKRSLKGIDGRQFKNIIITYEPFWAVGTDNPCSPVEAMQSALLIRKIVTNLYSREIAEQLSILYGGSVDSHNAADYVHKAHMNGLMIGRASLKVKEFVSLIKALNILPVLSKL